MFRRRKPSREVVLSRHCSLSRSHSINSRVRCRIFTPYRRPYRQPRHFERPAGCFQSISARNIRRWLQSGYPVNYHKILQFEDFTFGDPIKKIGQPLAWDEALNRVSSRCGPPILQALLAQGKLQPTSFYWSSYAII